MEKAEFTPRLSGGIFLTLLIQARKSRASHKETYLGTRDGLRESDLFYGLLKIASPKMTKPNDKSFRSNTTSYKSCQINSSGYINVTESFFVEAFKDRLKRDYSSVLKDTNAFISRFISVEREYECRILLAAILEIIKKDDSIAPNDTFKIGVNGKEVTKKDLLENTDKIVFQRFILGVWAFIIFNRPDNTVGRETFEMWNNKSSSKKSMWRFESTIGSEFLESIALIVLNDNDAQLNKGETKKSVIKLDGELVPYSNYIDKIIDKYGSLKTLLYADTPHKFYDFYVCNVIYKTPEDIDFINIISLQDKKTPEDFFMLKNATAPKLLRFESNFILLQGTGGLGKSMMMRHLLLDTAKNYQTYDMIPVFVPLKDYEEDMSLFDFIYNKISVQSADVDISTFRNTLYSGKLLILLDGLDEVNSQYFASFEKELESFTDRYSSNMFIVSSRPYSDFVSLSRFSRVRLKPFHKEQALELIDKLEFRTDAPKIKIKFREQLDKTLFDSHKEFAENPLLLTIMLMTFEQFAEIPSKMHIFYHEAFLTLSQKHDASKGAFKRTLKTELTAERFLEYLAEFCARTYHDEKFEFSEEEFLGYFNTLAECKRYEHENISGSDFLYDLKSNMCLIYFEGNKYHFTHRSFQEYFCALYFSKQMDKKLAKVGAFFENKNKRSLSDKTFIMLYDMIPDKVAEYIFLPYLDKLVNDCEANDGYSSFLKMMYPNIVNNYGETMEKITTEPASFIYKSLAEVNGIRVSNTITSLPISKKYAKTQFFDISDTELAKVFGRESENSPKIISVPYELSEERQGLPKKLQEASLIGEIDIIPIADLLKHPEKERDIFIALFDESFVLYKEYEATKVYYAKLKEKSNKVTDDLFDD